ncbi:MULTISPECIES: TRAP transporter substrate-binding protein [unclassified Sulfitobacter]|uniref:TRAP transporter substrate-binding protein n=1 Tax=unclassified Sulfitobacter TaxID=196795 RepID=UPI0007C33F2D|nr:MULTISPECIES: TRAP transporter substrate-binding protein [unclassified Sulfitobacter]KZX98473.1 hypothetical protein A3721_06365 [Sulfitobacter sp. HI0023]KZZ64293.1 hypothetical protein A3764_04670 [Sulfitobacter sp. HI0129]
MIMKRRTVLGGLAASTLMMTSKVASAATTTLKYGWFGPATEPTYARSMAPFGERVTNASNGAVQIDMYPGGTLGRDPSGQVKYLQDGVLDIAFIVPNYTPGRFPDNPVLELPGLFTSAAESTKVTWALFQRGLLRGYEDLHVLQLANGLPNLIHTAEPLTSLDGLSGLKLRVSGPTAGDAIRALGGTPVGMPVTQGAEAITRGVLDGTVSDWNTYAAFRLNEVAKNHLNVGLGQSPMLVAMTKKRWESLPQEARDAIDQFSYEPLSLEAAGVHDSIAADWKERVKTEPGHVLTELSDDEAARFDELIAPVIDNWVAQHERGEELITALREELAKVRAS